MDIAKIKRGLIDTGELLLAEYVDRGISYLAKDKAEIVRPIAGILSLVGSAVTSERYGRSIVSDILETMGAYLLSKTVVKLTDMLMGKAGIRYGAEEIVPTIEVVEVPTAPAHEEKKEEKIAIYGIPTY